MQDTVTRVPARSRLRAAAWILLPLLLGLLAFGPSIRGGFVWDDLILFTRWIAGEHSLKSIFFPDPHLLGVPYYKPVHAGSVYALYWVFGQHPAGWHAASVLLHLVTVGGVAVLLDRLLEAGPNRRFFAMVGAGAFACYPACAEAVAWSAARGDILIGAFGVWALVFHLRSRDRGARPLGAAFLFLLALLSKETAIAFVPATIVASALAPAAPDAKARGSAALLRSELWLPYVLAFVAYVWMRRMALGRAGTIGSATSGFASLELLPVMFHAWGFYVRQALLLGDGRPYQELVPGGLNDVFGALGVALIALSALATRRRELRTIPIGAAWFLLWIGPAVVVAAKSHTVTPVAIRYLYAPAIGVAVTFAAVAERLAAREWTVFFRRTAIGAGVAGAAGLVVLSNVRVGPWLTAAALWTRALQDYPDSVLPNLNFGTTLMDLRRPDEAEHYLRVAAWRAIPQEPTQKSRALTALAEYYLSQDRFSDARLCLIESMKYDSTPANIARNTAKASALSVYLEAKVGADGQLLVRRDLLEQQVSSLEGVAEIDPFEIDSQMILATIFGALHEPVRARHWLQHAARVATTDEMREVAGRKIAQLDQEISTENDPATKAYFDAEQAEYDSRDRDARAAYQRAHDLQPDRVDFIVALANLDSRLGDAADAESLMARATELAPENAMVWFNRGTDEERIGNYRAAADAFLQAEVLEPDWPKPYVNAGRALDQIGDSDGAAQQYRGFLARYTGPKAIRAVIEGRLAREPVHQE